MTYDGNQEPDRKQWLETEEGDRLRAVQEHHDALGARHAPTPNPRLHSAVHVVVENQLAAQDPIEVVGVLRKLRAEGLSRHDAIHAIMSVAVDHVLAVMSSGKKFDKDAYVKDLRELSAEKYRNAIEGRGN